jgi:hypothetical protein
MAGQTLQQSSLGWHGLEGDRRFGVRRMAEQGGFPWLTASKLPTLLCYQPLQHETAPENPLPTHVITPDGQTLGIHSPELAQEISQRYGAEVQLMQLKQGIFDEAAISLISLTTSHTITADSGQLPDIRRFRPNIVIQTLHEEPFLEDQWVGKVIRFGEGEASPAIHVTNRDQRCVMINLHPDSAHSEPALLKSVVRLNQNCAGVYGTVIQQGMLEVGQAIYLS